MQNLLTEHEKKFLDVIQSIARNHEISTGKDNLAGHCCSLSFVGAEVLKKRNFRAARWHVKGGNVHTPNGQVGHCWIEGSSENGPYFLDLTSDQFQYECPLLLPQRPDNYHVGQAPIELQPSILREMVNHAEGILKEAGF